MIYLLYKMLSPSTNRLIFEPLQLFVRIIVRFEAIQSASLEVYIYLKLSLFPPPSVINPSLGWTHGLKGCPLKLLLLVESNSSIDSWNQIIVPCPPSYSPPIQLLFSFSKYVIKFYISQP